MHGTAWAANGLDSTCPHAHQRHAPAPRCTQGTLAQIHLMEDGAPDYFVLGLLCAFFGTAMIIGSAQTLNGLREGTLDIKCVEDWLRGWGGTLVCLA